MGKNRQFTAIDFLRILEKASNKMPQDFYMALPKAFMKMGYKEAFLQAWDSEDFVRLINISLKGSDLMVELMRDEITKMNVTLSKVKKERSKLQVEKLLDTIEFGNEVSCSKEGIKYYGVWESVFLLGHAITVMKKARGCLNESITEIKKISGH